MEKQYVAQRPADEAIGDNRITIVPAEGEPYPLPCIEHHTDSYEWGYNGSGPATSALSILADYFGETTKPAAIHGRAWHYHQNFKDEFITGAPKSGFTINTEQIAVWLATQDPYPYEPLEDG